MQQLRIASEFENAYKNYFQGNNYPKTTYILISTENNSRQF